jgi:hypothetical protein
MSVTDEATMVMIILNVLPCVMSSRSFGWYVVVLYHGNHRWQFSTMFKAGDDVIITRKNKKVQYDIKGKKVVQGIHSTAATYDCR